jgi:hypothetical protein
MGAKNTTTEKTTANTRWKAVLHHKKKILPERLFPSKALVLIWLTALTAGCEDEQINWETQEVPQMLVVEGSLTSEYQRHQVRLTTSADYFSNQSTPGVSGASVKLVSSRDTFAYEESPNQEGLYLSSVPFAGQPGQSYTLNIRLQEPINQQTHYQASETMIPGMVLDTIEAVLYENPLYVENSPMDSLILYITAYGEEPKDIQNYYMVNLYRNQQALMDTIDEVEIYSDQEELEGRRVNHLFFFEDFQPGDTVGLKLFTISKGYRKYLDGLENIVNQSGNPFDLSGPPANAKGNIEGAQAVGYFRVSQVTHARTIVKKGE